MRSDFLSALRRLRGRWIQTAFLWGTATAAVAVFIALTAVVDGLLLKHPVAGGEQLMVLGRPDPRYGFLYGWTREELEGLAARLAIPIAAMERPQPLGRTADAPLQTFVSVNFFDILGVRALAGRTFDERDAGLTDRVVIGEALWRGRFGSAPDIVNRRVVIGERRVTVVGVAPARFAVPSGTSVWIPQDLKSKVSYQYRAIVRVPDATALQALEARLAGGHAQLLRDHLAPGDASHALVLLAAGALLLVAVWTYFALIHTSDAIRRLGESRLRIALGAGRWRAIRALLAESALSIGVCLGAGVALAPPTLAWLVSRLPAELLAGRPVAIDARASLVILLMLALALLVVAGIAVPAVLRSLRTDLTAGQHGARLSRHTARATRAIVALQFAVATPVLYVLGLAASSFHALISTDLGYHTSNVIAAQVPRAGSETFSFENEGRHLARVQQLVDRIAELPGVTAVAMSSDRLGYAPTRNRMRIRLREAGEKSFVITQVAAVSAGYFDLLGIRRVGGRTFSGRMGQTIDFSDVYGGVVVDRTLAQALGGGADVVGRAVVLDFTPATIIGVVEPVRSRQPDEPMQPRLYLHASPAAFFATNLLVRFTGPADSIRRSIALTVQAEFDSPGPADTVLLDDELRRLQGPYRGRYHLLSLMGWIAAALCVAGIFGVGTYTVARRRRELAVRMAVGASRSRILWTSVRDIVLAATAGTLAGLAFGITIGRAAAHLLYGVAPLDPVVLVGVVLALLTAVATGAALPAHEAWRTDISAVLRQE